MKKFLPHGYYVVTLPFQVRPICDNFVDLCNLFATKKISVARHNRPTCTELCKPPNKIWQLYYTVLAKIFLKDSYKALDKFELA